MKANPTKPSFQALLHIKYKSHSTGPLTFILRLDSPLLHTDWPQLHRVMASTRFLALVFFIALSISSIDTAQASRKLLAPTSGSFPSFPGLTFPPLPPLPAFLTTPIFPEFRLPPPITTSPDFPSVPTLPFFSPPAIPTTP
ncbi:RNA-binding protein 12-like [Quillaja saponaria]|uniref:RNA-binding protein 12-like n=1 Tax=Quillaja saponaria TaxID=32244 RepID=A0AAD7PUW1_QUISA|nr:RNA-binding protein 12-like [Quillaja saponaria]